MWSSDAKRTSQGFLLQSLLPNREIRRRFTFRVRPRDHAESTSPHLHRSPRAPNLTSPCRCRTARQRSRTVAAPATCRSRRRRTRRNCLVHSADIRENRTPFVISAEVVGRSRQVPLQMDRVFPMNLSMSAAVIFAPFVCSMLAVFFVLAWCFRAIRFAIFSMGMSLRWRWAKRGFVEITNHTVLVGKAQSHSFPRLWPSRAKGELP